jgi:hypothetical protein
MLCFRKHTQAKPLERMLILFIIGLLSLSIPKVSISGQSTIVEVEGYSCMGDDKSRKDTKNEAITAAKRSASESASTYMQSETTVKDFQLKKDLVEAYSRSQVKVISLREIGWYKDANSGECFKVQLKAEVVPDNKFTDKLKNNDASLDDPLSPLLVKLWVDKSTYHLNDKIKIFIKGNKPFYARIIYKDIAGTVLQLLPNPQRDQTYFNGGTIYEIPTNEDKFDLTVAPPFGKESIIAYASTSPLGDIDSTTSGGVYHIRTAPSEIGIRTKGVMITDKNPAAQSPSEKNRANSSEFYENALEIITEK